MTAKGPLALVKDGFGDKAKLVEAIEKFAAGELWVARTNEKKGLAHVSNAKLLRLHATFSEVKERFGTREKLVDAVLELEKRPKDAGLRQRLSAWPVPRLYDAYKAAKKRSGQSEPGAIRTPVPKGARNAAADAPIKPKGAKKSTKAAAKAAPTSRKPAKKAAQKGGGKAKKTSKKRTGG